MTNKWSTSVIKSYMSWVMCLQLWPCQEWHVVVGSVILELWLISTVSPQCFSSRILVIVISLTMACHKKYLGSLLRSHGQGRPSIGFGNSGLNHICKRCVVHLSAPFPQCKSLNTKGLQANTMRSCHFHGILPNRVKLHKFFECLASSCALVRKETYSLAAPWDVRRVCCQD